MLYQGFSFHLNKTFHKKVIYSIFRKYLLAGICQMIENICKPYPLKWTSFFFRKRLKKNATKCV